MSITSQPISPRTWAVALPIGLILLALILYLVHHHNTFFQDQQVRTITIGVIGIVVLVLANNAIIGGIGNIEVKYVIAFDTVIFIVLGLIALVSAAPNWGMAALCAGTCLFGGGIIGLLFGLPLGTEQVKDKTFQAQADARQQMDSVNLATAKAIASNAPEHAPSPEVVQAAQVARQKADAQVAGSNSRNLLSETADSLGKLLAGASLAKFGDLHAMFKSTAVTISGSISPGQTSPTLGGSLILYFGLIGFISGLLLPAYFMDKWQEGGSHNVVP
jgi:hypothetical protein